MNCVGNRNQRSKRGIQSRLIAALLVLFALEWNGCRVVKESEELPMSAIGVVVPGTQGRQPSPEALQTEVLRFADSFSGETSVAMDQYASQVNTPEGRIEALQWKVRLNSSALNIATGPNPAANLVDLVTLATLTRAAVEERAPQALPPGALDPWLNTSRVQETNAWNLAAVFLAANLRHQLRAAIEQWRAENPTGSGLLFERPQVMASAIREAGQKQNQPGSVFSLVGLDPVSGLDPAVREVTRTRLFAERALYAAERMPFLLRWQAELLSDQVLSQNQVSGALQSIDRLSRAAESISQTAALLPDRISTERKAILDALEAQEGKLQALTAGVDQTLTAGDKMSTSLNTTLITFTALMKLFGVGVPSTAPPDTNSPPFNILDYARTAEQVANMSQQLNELVKSASGTVETPALDKRIAELNALAGRTRADAKSVLNHAFLLATAFMVLGFACAWVFRRLPPPGKNTPGSVAHP
jgi:hypothetical protein